MAPYNTWFFPSVINNNNNDDDDNDDDDCDGGGGGADAGDNGDKTAFSLGRQRVLEEALSHSSHFQRANVTKEFFQPLAYFLSGRLSIYDEAKIKNTLQLLV